MADVSVSIDGRPVLVQMKRQGGQIYVDLKAFCELVNAEAKRLEDNGPLAVCRDDLCIPLNTNGGHDTLDVDGVLFGRLGAFAEPLGLTWSMDGDGLRVKTEQLVSGLGIGHVPPAFTLPDIYTGESVALSDYRGKKTVFYMWASW